MALLEVCCGNLESVDAAVAGGAPRIELCADLESDGLTPPVDWIRDVKARYPSLTVHVLIRPRAGDFVYSPEEADTMIRQTEMALEAGTDGIVVGGLTSSRDVDRPLMERVVSLVKSLQDRPVSLTFHRAFDRCHRPFGAMEQIIDLGFDRILTSGQGPTVIEGADMLRELQRRARGRIGILPGGGVTPRNAARILAATGCAEIHASASVTIDGKKVTEAEIVTAILQSISS